MSPFPQYLRQAQLLTRQRRINPGNTQYIPVVKIFAFLDL